MGMIRKEIHAKGIKLYGVLQLASAPIEFAAVDASSELICSCRPGFRDGFDYGFLANT